MQDAYTLDGMMMRSTGDRSARRDDDDTVLAAAAGGLRSIQIETPTIRVAVTDESDEADAVDRPSYRSTWKPEADDVDDDTAPETSQEDAESRDFLAGGSGGGGGVPIVTSSAVALRMPRKVEEPYVFSLAQASTLAVDYGAGGGGGRRARDRRRSDPGDRFLMRLRDEQAQALQLPQRRPERDIGLSPVGGPGGDDDDDPDVADLIGSGIAGGNLRLSNPRLDFIRSSSQQEGRDAGDEEGEAFQIGSGAAAAATAAVSRVRSPSPVHSRWSVRSRSLPFQEPLVLGGVTTSEAHVGGGGLSLARFSAVANKAAVKVRSEFGGKVGSPFEGREPPSTAWTGGAGAVAAAASSSMQFLCLPGEVPRRRHSIALEGPRLETVVEESSSSTSVKSSRRYSIPASASSNP